MGQIVSPNSRVALWLESRATCLKYDEVSVEPLWRQTVVFNSKVQQVCASSFEASTTIQTFTDIAGSLKNMKSISTVLCLNFQTVQTLRMAHSRCPMIRPSHVKCFCKSAFCFICDSLRKAATDKRCKSGIPPERHDLFPNFHDQVVWMLLQNLTIKPHTLVRTFFGAYTVKP